MPNTELVAMCGQLVVGGFAGPELSPRFAEALRQGRRGGAILFKRNVLETAQIARLCASIVEAAGPSRPPFVGVDQEGGRVTRLPAPALKLPPMRTLGELGDLAMTRRAASAVAVELGALGFNLNFAPVLDVDSNPANPIIGDRAFGADPRTVMRHGVAFLEGLQDRGVLACGKHFPGHGDTSVDSHVDLPTIAHDRARLERIELPPFRAASGSGVASLMTAHVVVDALDKGVPATLSRAICASLLRAEIGFEGVLFSDDLEMAAVARMHPVETLAVEAVWAGCDALLVCSDEDKQDQALEALVRQAEKDKRFRDRCAEAAGRCLRVRKLAPPKPVTDERALRAMVGGPASKELEDALAAALESRRKAMH